MQQQNKLYLNSTLEDTYEKATLWHKTNITVEERNETNISVINNVFAEQEIKQ